MPPDLTLWQSKLDHKVNKNPTSKRHAHKKSRIEHYFFTKT